MAALTAFGDNGLDQALSAILQIEERVPAVKRTVKQAAPAPRHMRTPRYRPGLRELRLSRGASAAVAASLGLAVLGAAAVTSWNTLRRPASEDRIAEAEPVRAAPVTAAVANVVARMPESQAPASIDSSPVEPVGALPAGQTTRAATSIVRLPSVSFVGAARSAERRAPSVVVRRVSRLATGQGAVAATTRSLTPPPVDGSRQTQREANVQVAAMIQPTTTITVPLSLMQSGSTTLSASAAARPTSAETPPARVRRDGVDAIRSLRRQW